MSRAAALTALLALLVVAGCRAPGIAPTAVERLPGSLEDVQGMIGQDGGSLKEGTLTAKGFAGGNLASSDKPQMSPASPAPTSEPSAEPSRGPSARPTCAPAGEVDPDAPRRKPVTPATPCATPSP